MPSDRAVDVAVVGGGITGLAAAWILHRSAPSLAVTLYEAGDRVGGKIRTTRLDGTPVEAGPDTFLARVPWAVDLCRQLGLGDELVAPATAKAYIWTRGGLRPLPEGTVLGVPARLGPLARSGIVSPAGLSRAALDAVLPRSSRPGDDPSVAEVVGGRFGDEVVDRLVEPLLGGIHAGRASRLSLEAVAPNVAAAARSSRSLMAGLRSAPASASGPVFLGLRGGLGRLVDRLVQCLDVEGVEVRTGARVRSLDDVRAHCILLALPAFAAEPLVRPTSPAAADELAAIAYASVVTVTLAYPAAALAESLDGSGFLVPRVDGRLLTACTWSTSKWAIRPPDGQILLRASAGRIGDDRAMELPDDVLVDALHRELTEAMHLRRRPEASVVTRWPRSFPQYDVGHRARVDRIEAALAADAPGVVVAGAAYRGVGIASCIRDAQRAADAIVARATTS